MKTKPKKDKIPNSSEETEINHIMAEVEAEINKTLKKLRRQKDKKTLDNIKTTGNKDKEEEEEEVETHNKNNSS